MAGQWFNLGPVARTKCCALPGADTSLVDRLGPELEPSLDYAIDLHSRHAMHMQVLLVLWREETPREPESLTLAWEARVSHPDVERPISHFLLTASRRRQYAP